METNHTLVLRKLTSIQQTAVLLIGLLGEMSLRLSLLACVAVWLSFGSMETYAQSLAFLDSKQGQAQALLAGKDTWQEVEKGAAFQPHDTLKLGAKSRAGVLFADGILVRLNEFAILEFKEKRGSQSPIKLESGKAFFFSREPKSFPEIETPTVTASVRGTEFVIEVEKDKTVVSVLDGMVECNNQFGSVSVGRGEQALTIKGQAPVKKILLQPKDAVQWALHVPAIFDESSISDLPESQRTQIKTAWSDITSAHFDEAQTKLAQLEPESKQNSKLRQVYLSLNALTLLAKNEKESASNLMQEVKLDKDSSAFSALVQSYISQAQFDLNGATEWARFAAKKNPSDVSTQARLSELALGAGDIDQAVEHAEAAIKLNPNHPYALSTLGFAKLASYEFESACQDFRTSIIQDPAYGMPHVGLGLCLIRLGELENGRAELEKAVFLEPTTSLFRSYLGKAYFEEEREESAGKEYNRAIELDPLDPTPHLYRAYQKLSTHRPVEALADVENAILLNDNRAVYRSRLLLDQDASVKSASLAQVFKSIGFEEVARIEAIKSISRDYTNYAAHSFLADIYNRGTDTVSAQISESLISRLLSPVSFNLVLPTASSEASFNEYSSLFDRAQTRTSFTTEARTRDRFVDTTVSNVGLYGRGSYALEYQAVYGDGFRDNDATREHVLYGSGQYQLSPSDTLLLDSNVSFIDDGDTILGYDPYTNDPDYNLKINDGFIRGGFNHRFGARSHFIAQVLYNDSTLKTRDGNLERPIVILTPEDSADFSAIFPLVYQSTRFASQGLRADTQYLQDTDLVSFALGVGVLDSTQRQNESATFDDDSAELISSAENDEASQRTYLYSTWHLTDWSDVTAGINYTHIKVSDTPTQVPFIEGTDTDERWNPKVGLMLYPTGTTTLRGAYFENLGTSGIREFELIEPTLVSGFNQAFFDVFPGTESKNFGFGVDQKFPNSTYFGSEYVHRYLTQSMPGSFSTYTVDTETGEILDTGTLLFPDITHSEQQIVRSYVYQIFTSTITGIADHTWSLSEDDSAETSIDTDRVRLGLQYFDPSGWFLFSRGTWRSQSLEGYDPEVDQIENGNRDFWLVDAGFGYQLPKRHGQFSISFENIFDRDFHYIPTGLEPDPLPGFGVVGRISFNF